MATKSENAEIAVLQSQMEDVTKSLGDLKVAQDTNFKALSDKLDGIPYSISAVEARVTVLEKRSTRSWINNSLAALLGAILSGMVALITYLLTK